MRRRTDESSQVHFGAGDDIGDYAFHEFQNSEQWFVDEMPDGRSRWEGLPASHPLSMAWLLRRPQAMPNIPPPIPRLKVPMLEKAGVRLTLIGAIAAALIGLISFGVHSTHASESPAAAAPVDPVSAQPELLPTPSPPMPTLEPKLALLTTLKAPATKSTHQKKHAKHGKHKIARR